MKPDNRSSELPQKRSYHRPQLQVYGDLREITNTVTKAGKVTDPGHPTARSH